jgi:hypothetical protein
MSDGREMNGRFAIGNRANPNGRPRKNRSVNDTILREIKAPVTVTENNKRRKISKLEANAKQIANLGASGDLRAAKLTMDLALRAEGARETSPAPLPLTENDRAIAERFIARLSLTQIQEKSDDDYA